MTLSAVCPNGSTETEMVELTPPMNPESERTNDGSGARFWLVVTVSSETSIGPAPLVTKFRASQVVSSGKVNVPSAMSGVPLANGWNVALYRAPAGVIPACGSVGRMAVATVPSSCTS